MKVDLSILNLEEKHLFLPAVDAKVCQANSCINMELEKAAVIY